MHSFRLTEPVSSNKIYVTVSLKHGANKCLNELNQCNTSCDNFTIVDINTKTKYKFVLNKKDDKKKENNDDVKPQNNMINDLYGRVKYLESQLFALNGNDSNNSNNDDTINISDVRELE